MRNLEVLGMGMAEDPADRAKGRAAFAGGEVIAYMDLAALGLE